MLALWGLSKVVKLLESRGSIGRGNDSLDMSGSAGYFVIGMGIVRPSLLISIEQDVKASQ